MPISWIFLFPVNLLFTQREYFKQGKIEQFRQILEEGSGPGQFFFNAFVFLLFHQRIFDYALLVLFLTVAWNPQPFYLYLIESPFFFAEIDEYYADVKYERIAILNALGAFHTFLGKVERAPQKEAHFKDATQYYNRASRIDETEPSTWIGKGSTFLNILISRICFVLL